jgi:DMSO/TMAO reductase YedYZ molybdopterin-dependent catalytic subunit
MLGTLAAAGAAPLVDPGPMLARLLQERNCGVAEPLGTLLGTIPLFRTGAPEQPFGVKLGGSGLDARQVTDLSRLQPDRLITPNPLAFIRTERPPAAASVTRWTIKVSGLNGDGYSLTPSDLAGRARGMGAHLLECSGNNNPANFGLMSVSEWDGVPLSDMLSRLRRSPAATCVVVSGMDFEDGRSRDSIDGASWAFPLASLDRVGVFLGVRMNGDPLPPDHGAPVRLVVPGWYGCTWIKWVNEIRLASAGEQATSQMKEFAGRTHQTARHDLARDYAPADIQTAATPVRIEKRLARQAGDERRPANSENANRVEYRIVGIVWGGDKPVDRLAIRFGANAPWTPFSICPPPTTSKTWTLWEYRWKPSVPGVYDISLSVPDRSVPQRRLDTSYYMRQVRIDEI